MTIPLVWATLAENQIIFIILTKDNFLSLSADSDQAEVLFINSWGT